VEQLTRRGKTDAVVGQTEGKTVETRWGGKRAGLYFTFVGRREGAGKKENKLIGKEGGKGGRAGKGDGKNVVAEKHR